MNSSKLRRQIAWEAARLMYYRQESEYYRAKLKAAKSIFKGWVHPADLPSNAEIRDEILVMARMLEGEGRTQKLREMRFGALLLMRKLERFKPKLIGSTFTGHIRQGSDIDIHLFADSLESITSLLERENLRFTVERKQVRKDGEEVVFTHIHVEDDYRYELTVYPTSKVGYAFKSSITGKAIEKASIPQLEAFLAEEYPGIDIDNALQGMEHHVDRYQTIYSLLLPLENVKQHPKYHPEGDVLYHSLQVFDLARDELPYDEEFLLAALLHDVGKGVDPDDHVGSGVAALDGLITERTAWLIEHHMEAQQILDGTLGARAKRRLQENESYDELMTLARCDRAGRQVGVEAPELEEAIDYLRDLAYDFGS